MKNNIIKRQKYLQKIIPFIDKQIIKAFTGQRRVGKSYILLQIIDILTSKIMGKKLDMAIMC